MVPIAGKDVDPEEVAAGGTVSVIWLAVVVWVGDRRFGRRRGSIEDLARMLELGALARGEELSTPAKPH